MNNEIKEILDFKENADYKRLSCDEIKVLKDYITNLQQRIEKAVEYIEEMQVWCIEFDNYGVITDGLLNILNGRSDE